MLSDVISYLPPSFKLAPSDLHLSGPLKNARQQFDNDDIVQLYRNCCITMLNIEKDARYKYME